MRLTKFAALAAAGSLTLAACGGGESPAEKNNSETPSSSGGGASSPAADASSSDASSSADASSSSSGEESSSSDAASSDKPSGGGSEAAAGMDPEAKGPAKEVEGAKTGGTLRILASGAPTTFDPSAQFYQDVNAILNLTTRRLTQYRTNADGTSELVPDLATDLGTVSEDGLTWTFTLKDGLKYEDGSPITAEDVAYGIKRSFAVEELPGGPTYQMDYLKDGDKYKGPFQDGEEFAGVKAVDDKTIEIHLKQEWPTLPYFASFTQMSPVPKDKDTKEEYTNKPVSTGPYKFQEYQQGAKLVLTKNENWDPKTDPARHQYPDTIEFTFGGDFDAQGQQIAASNGPDQFALSYDGVPGGVAPQFQGDLKDRLASGASPCVSYVSMDTRKIPLEVRKAIATAWPYDQIRKAGGSTELDFEPAISYMSPAVAGFDPEPSEGLTGQGTGDPEAAKKMLAEAGKEGFELSWYYSVDNPVAQKTNAARKAGLEKAGFKVKDQGVPRAEIRELIQAADAETNMLMGPAGWCYDWPQGDAVYPAIFLGSAQTSGHSVGFLKEEKLDKEMNRIKALPAEEQGAEWTKFDKMVRDEYLPAIPTDMNKATAIFGSKVHNVQIDPNAGMPNLAGVWVDGE